MRFAASAVILTAIWYILSGKFDLIHFGTGVVTALVIAAAFSGWSDGLRLRPLRFLAYLPWLAWQVFLSNLRVARLVLQPNMPIKPTFLARKPKVRGDRALTTLAASTTLTPGTLTVDISADEIFVHALDAKSAADVRDAVADPRVARAFDEIDE
jgi:multicomponent Na+:H+ antiporter subunit E